jgi:hypothetical protein
MLVETIIIFSVLLLLLSLTCIFGGCVGLRENFAQEVDYREDDDTNMVTMKASVVRRGGGEPNGEAVQAAGTEGYVQREGGRNENVTPDDGNGNPMPPGAFHPPPPSTSSAEYHLPDQPPDAEVEAFSGEGLAAY